MKLLLVTILMLGSGLLSNAEDVNTANTKLINSMIAVSSEQFSRASAYINQYNSANLNLTLVAGRIQASFMGIIDLTPLQSFFTDIQNVLNDNVQQLTVKFSPASVQSYILGFYQSFLTNLLLNNGTAAEISAMNLVYYGKILSPNATVCINKYNALYEEIYSRAAGNFTQAVETQVSSTVTRLETLKNEIETLVTNLVKSFDQIIEEKSFASIGSFIASNTLTLGSTVINWVGDFSSVMKETQQNIKDSFSKYDSARVNDTQRIVQQTLDCLKAA